jgi:hypothetical protein
MPIPQTPEFDEILGRLALVSNPGDQIAAAKELSIRPALDSTGELRPENRLFLMPPAGTTISIDGLIKRTTKELQQTGHIVTEELTIWLLAIFCSFVRIIGKKGSVAELNYLMGCVGDADVNLYYTFSPRVSHEYAFRVGHFSFGPLDIAKLRYQCEQAQSDYFVRWEPSLRHQSAVQRDPLRIRVLDIPRIQQRFGSPETKDKVLVALWGTILDGYFGALASRFFESFVDELYDFQHVLVAFGAPRLDPRFFSRVLGANMVAVFLGIGEEKAGFVAPAVIGQLRIDLVNAHKRIPQTIHALREEFEFEGFDGSALHELIHLFVKFVSRSTELRDETNYDEAILQLIVALEIVFARRQNIAESTTERAAAIISTASRLSFTNVCDVLGELYDKRSRYVHQGHRAVNSDEVDALLLLIRPVLVALMKLQTDPQRRTKESIEAWLVHLDFASKSLLVGRDLDEKDRAIVLGSTVSQ